MIREPKRRARGEDWFGDASGYGERNPSTVNALAEQSVLGALIIRPDLLRALPETFRAEHYVLDGHPDIHAIIEGRADGGGSLAVYLDQAWAAGDPVKRAYLADLLKQGALSYTPATITRYATLLTDLYHRRACLDVAQQIRETAIASGEVHPTDSILAAAMARLDTIATAQTSARPGISFNDALDEAVRSIEAASRREGPAGLPTGFAALDAALGGLEDETYNILAGRPGMGKSALAAQIAVNVAGLGIGVDVISLEMGAMQIARRSIAAEAGVPLARLRSGKLIGDDGDRIARARRKLGGLPLTIEDVAGLKLSQIAARARTAKRKHGLGLLVLDHLHIVAPEPGDVRQGATWAIGKVSNGIKQIAKMFECPVLACAQLNRGVEGREDKRPTLADLRQTGEIEQDADSVTFMYRQEYYLQKEPERGPGMTEAQHDEAIRKFRELKASVAGKAEAIITKLREGDPTTIPLYFNADTVSFEEAEGRDWR